MQLDRPPACISSAMGSMFASITGDPIFWLCTVNDSQNISHDVPDCNDQDICLGFFVGLWVYLNWMSTCFTTDVVIYGCGTLVEVLLSCCKSKNWSSKSRLNTNVLFETEFFKEFQQSLMTCSSDVSCMHGTERPKFWLQLQEYKTTTTTWQSSSKCLGMLNNIILHRCVHRKAPFTRSRFSHDGPTNYKLHNCHNITRINTCVLFCIFSFVFGSLSIWIQSATIRAVNT